MPKAAPIKLTERLFPFHGETDVFLPATVCWLTDVNCMLSQVGRKYCCNTNKIVSQIKEKQERKEQMMMNLFSSVSHAERGAFSHSLCEG